MYVPDTDHLSLLERVDNIDKQRLRNRLGKLREGEVAASIIAFEEQIRGWTAYLSTSKTTNQQVDAYRRLRLQLNNYCSIIVLDFDDRAAKVFQDLKDRRLKVGTMDLKDGLGGVGARCNFTLEESARFHKSAQPQG